MLGYNVLVVVKGTKEKKKKQPLGPVVNGSPPILIINVHISIHAVIPRYYGAQQQLLSWTEGGEGEGAAETSVI